MKTYIILLAILGLLPGFIVAHKELATKEKFLLEIVYRISEPLMFEEWIKLGKNFTIDKVNYKQFNKDMENFYKAYELQTILPKGEFFGALIKSHLKQANGLFNLFYYANNWDVFQRNVAWARIHCNEGMFVYALNMAITFKQDLQGLSLPTISEIFPQHFFHSKFVYAAKKFNHDNWHMNSMYEDYYESKYEHDIPYLKIKEKKIWQWWKRMSLGEQWLWEDYIELRFWMPIDYSRDIDLYNKESRLSYFTEDVELNSYWYYLNMRHAFYFHDNNMNKKNRVNGNTWFHNIRQLLARYHLERLSLGLGKIPDFSFFKEIENGYNPQLVYHNGIGFSYRKNYYKIENYGKYDYYFKVFDFFERMNDIIAKGVYVLRSGDSIDLRKPDAIKHIGHIMHTNVDQFDKYFFNFWHLFARIYFGHVNTKDSKVIPNVFLNYETMMRDPLFYMFFNKVFGVFKQLFYYEKPYTQKELLMPGVSIENVEISDLVTFDDINDFDVTNLLKDEITFFKGEFFWEKTLVTRQVILNHKPIHFNFTLILDKPQTLLMRIFLAPKYDEFGRVISLNKNRDNFMAYDSFIISLPSGLQQFNYSVKESIQMNMAYAELYRHVLVDLDDEGIITRHFEKNKPYCFPKRLLLPRGCQQGMPVQFFFYASPFTQANTNTSAYDNNCFFGSEILNIDNKPIGYPFEREIHENEFIVPNMFFRDAKIYYKADLELFKYVQQQE